MNQLSIPDMTNILTARPARRDLLRALAGVGLGVAATRLATPMDANAGKKRKKKAQPQMAQVCQPGAVIGSVSVPATGATVNTPVLAQGQRYRLRASGGRSALAAQVLQTLGYQQVAHLDGGLKAWREAGFSIAADA